VARPASMHTAQSGTMEPRSSGVLVVWPAGGRSQGSTRSTWLRRLRGRSRNIGRRRRIARLFILNPRPVVPPRPSSGRGEIIVSATPRMNTSRRLLDHYSTCAPHQSGPAPDRPNNGPGSLATTPAGPELGLALSDPALFQRLLAWKPCLIPRLTDPRPGPSRSSPVCTDSGTSTAG
jgi:hypothetical protein